MGKTLLCYSSRPEDQEFGREVARIAELNFTSLLDLPAVIHHIRTNDVGALFIDVTDAAAFRRLETGIQEEIGIFSDQVNTNRIHFIGSDDLEQHASLLQSQLFGHFVLRKYRDEATAKLAGVRYGYVVKATCGDRAFGLGQFFSEKAQIQNIRMQKSSQKQQVVEAIRSYLLKAKYPTRMANVIANAVDELIMNAIFAAPVDELGTRIFERTPRDTEMELVGKQLVEVTIAFDGQQVGISAVDQFGAIDKAKLLQHLSTAYTAESYKVRSSVAGAGIGLATTFRSGGSLLFICEKNSRTEVAVIFERLDNYREFKDQFRFITTQFYY